MIIIDGLGRILTVIFVGILICMIPLRYKMINYQRYTQNHIGEHTSDFVNQVMEKGYMDMEMYEGFIHLLNPSKTIYKVELIHSTPKLVLGPYNDDIKRENIETIIVDNYSEDILEEIRKNEIYYFRQGDYFTVNIYITSEGFISNINQFFGITNLQNKYTYGGIVYDRFF